MLMVKARRALVTAEAAALRALLRFFTVLAKRLSSSAAWAAMPMLSWTTALFMACSERLRSLPSLVYSLEKCWLERFTALERSAWVNLRAKEWRRRSLELTVAATMRASLRAAEILLVIVLTIAVIWALATRVFLFSWLAAAVIRRLVFLMALVVPVL